MPPVHGPKLHAYPAPIAAPNRNLELKAKEPERSLAACESLGAEAAGVLTQRDTYFAARHGRLKLREENGVSAQLIAYERSDEESARESSYLIVPIGRPRELKEALESTLGVAAVVAKERRLFLWRGVRIHLDQVEGLGTYVEFEAVLGPDLDLDTGRDRIEALRAAFGIEECDLLAGSYVDLAASRDASKKSIGPERSA